jgi:hypothetical protein
VGLPRAEGLTDTYSMQGVIVVRSRRPATLVAALAAVGLVLSAAASASASSPLPAAKPVYVTNGAHLPPAGAPPPIGQPVQAQPVAPVPPPGADLGQPVYVQSTKRVTPTA